MLNLFDYIVDVKDYPKEGIVFKDLTPILLDCDAYNKATKEILALVKTNFPNATHIVSPEARGFWFGCPVAVEGKYGFVPVRKPKKLPRETKTVSYDLEYGSEVLCMHSDAIKPCDKIVIIDDVLATGGTLGAIEDLISNFGAVVLGSVVLLELSFLNGRANAKKPIKAVLTI